MAAAQKIGDSPIYRGFTPTGGGKFSGKNNTARGIDTVAGIDIIPLATIKKSRFAGLPAKYHSTEPGGLMPAERIGRAFNIFLIVATARRHCAG
ncbi:MAG: hypothetical protein OXU98_04410 [Gammaproteobacteria bacterium]|nr:hypothetical protein [Gammaproteobacteria bacterium]